MANAYTDLVQATAAAFRKEFDRAQISVDIPWSPAGVDGRYYDWLGLSQAADVLFVMAYDMQSQVGLLVVLTCILTPPPYPPPPPPLLGKAMGTPSSSAMHAVWFTLLCCGCADCGHASVTLSLAFWQQTGCGETILLRTGCGREACHIEVVS